MIICYSIESMMLWFPKQRQHRTLWASLVAWTVESACSVGDNVGFPRDLGRSPGEGNRYPL